MPTDVVVSSSPSTSVLSPSPCVVIDPLKWTDTSPAGPGFSLEPPLPLPKTAQKGCGQSAGSKPRGFRALYARELERMEAGEVDLAGEAADSL